MYVLSTRSFVVVAVIAGCRNSPTPILSQLGAGSWDSVTQLVALTTAMAAMDGGSGLAASNSLVVDSDAIFYNCAGTYAVPQGATGEASCGATRCTFDMNFVGELSEPYESPQPYAYAFSGSAAFEASQLTLKLQQGHGAAEANATWTLDGTVTMSQSELDGTLHLSGNTALNADWNTCGPGTTSSTVEYQRVALDANGCPIGGSIYAVTTMISTIATENPTEAFDGTLELGPACGEVR